MFLSNRRPRWAAHEPVVIAAALACGIAGCDDRTDPIEHDESAVLAESSQRTAAPAERDGSEDDARTTASGRPFQVTVLDEDELDTDDPTVLQIAAPQRHEAFVVAGARALLELGRAEAGATTIRLAQDLLLKIARADAVVIAEAVAHSEPRGERRRIDVTFATVDALKGEVADEWRLGFASEPDACAPRGPDLGERVLVFLRATGRPEKMYELHGEGAVKVVRDGRLVGLPGLSVTPAILKAAHEAAKEAQR